MAELKWFFMLLLVLFVFWSITGGSERTENKTNPFLEQPEPIEKGEIYGKAELEKKHPFLFPTR